MTNLWGIHNDTLAEELLQEDFVSIGWDELGDLSQIRDGRDGLKSALNTALPDHKPRAVPLRRLLAGQHVRRSGGRPSPTDSPGRGWNGQRAHSPARVRRHPVHYGLPEGPAARIQIPALAAHCRPARVSPHHLHGCSVLRRSRRAVANRMNDAGRLTSDSPRQARAHFRAGLRRPTSGMAQGYAQAHLLALPREHAFDMLLFAHRNPKSCPVLGVLEAGQPTSELLGGPEEGDIRTDLPVPERSRRTSPHRASAGAWHHRPGLARLR